MANERLRAALDAALGRLNEDALHYEHGHSSGGEPLDPDLFVNYKALRAALAAAPLPSEPESEYDFAWLIETGRPPRWYGSWATGRDPWTTDATLAVRFPDKADAEAFIAAKDIAGIAVEHGFRRAAPLPSDTPADGLDVERLIYAVHQAINGVPAMVVTNTEYVPQAKRRADAVVDRHRVIAAVRDAIREYAALALTQEPRSGDDR